MSIWTRLLVKILSWFVNALPARLRWWAGVALGTLWFDILRFRRFTVLKNVSIAFPQLSHPERMTIARQSLWYMCAGLPDILRFPTINQSWLEKEVIIHGEEHFQKALQEKKGILFLSLHLGVGDLGIAAMSLKGWPVHVISKKFKNKKLNDFWFGLRENLGTQFIESHGTRTAFEILKALKDNHSVVFVIDQFMGRPFGIPTTFFGRKTGTAYGLSLFAIKTGAPVLPVYTYRDEQFRTHLVVEEPIPLDHSEDRDVQTLQMTEKYNRKVEEIIKKHPKQWMWVHRRWKRWE